MWKQMLGVLSSTLALACSQNPVALDAAGAIEPRCWGGTVHGDAELARFAGCRDVQGDLAFSGVTTLAPMLGLTRVAGKLAIVDSDELRDLSGLDSLRQVGKLELRGNDRLDDLSALAKLERAGSIVISENPELASLEGLSKVTSLDELVLENNGLGYVDGLENLRHVGRLVIAGNSKLIGIGALNGVESVNELSISNNRRLSGYFGVLRGLASVPTTANVEGNRGLSSEDTSSIVRTGRREVASR